MGGERRYWPVDPAAYGGRPRLLGLLRGLRERQAPFVVDARGVFVGETAAGRGDAHLVPWETIREIVVLGVPGRRSPLAIGLRTRRHPDVVSMRRELDAWTLRRARLEAAVARFAPGVPVVEAPAWDTRGRPHRRYWTTDPYEREVLAHIAAGFRQDALAELETAQVVAADPGRRPDGRRPGVAHPVTHDHVAYVPSDAAAYVVRLSPAARDVVLAVDAPGVHFGPTGDDGEPEDDLGLVAWADIASVVVFDIQHTQEWRRAVGVTAVGRPASDIVRARTAEGWRLDRPALEAAVERFAPDVPVVDGPPLPRPSIWRVAAVYLGERRRLGRGGAVDRAERWPA